MLSHATSLPLTPTLQRRHMPRLYPYAPVERASAPLSPLSEPRRQSMGQLPLPAQVETLLVPRLSAHLQRSHPHAVRPEPAVTPTLDFGDLSAVPLVFVSSHCEGIGCPYPYQLSLVLVVA